MAINKRKILEAAQKFLQKGSLDKALKEYQSLVQADPRDSNSRLKLGDIHLKLGQKDEAIAAYLKVADQFMKDGFDAKAVALYKQITKIDSHRSDVQVPLAELYQRLGLTSEAMTALQTAADAYHREGRKRDALDLLRKMATLDPTNTTSRMKIAELLRQAGLKDEAIAEYQEVATELARHDEPEALILVFERVLELDPARESALVGLSRALLASGKPDRAMPFARRATEVSPDGTDGFELLAESYRALGRTDEMEPVYRRLADLHRQHGDEDRAREILQRFVSASPLEKSAEESSPFAFGAPSESEPEVLDDTPAPRDAFGDSFDQTHDSDDASFFETAAPVQSGESSGGDLEQVLAEASVYLRYGKHDRAIAGLEAVLGRDPENRAALEKLGEALSSAGDSARAVSTWAEAAKLARAAGDLENVSLLCDRIDSLMPGQAEARGLRDGPPAPQPAPAAARQGPAATAGAEAPDDPFVDVDVDLHGPEGASAVAPADEDDAPDDLEIDVDTDLPDDELSLDDGAGTGTDAAGGEGGGDASEGSGGSSTTPQQIVEDLEEAEFYFHQGLHDEATAVYRRVLVAAPNHPQALLRLGEIAAAKGEDPGRSSQAGKAPLATAPAATPAPTPKKVKAEETDPGLGEDVGSWADELSADLSQEEAAPAGGAGKVDRDAASASLDLSSLADEVEDGGLAGEASVGAGASAAARVGVTEPDLAGHAASSDTAPELGDAPASPEAFDLAAELTDALADDDRRGGGRPGVDDGFEAVFREFKRGVQRTVSEADHETHYDLGIAYREMGLLEDAVGEFRLAMESPARKLDCLHMLGLCALDLKRPQDAVAHLEQALALPGVPDDQQVGLRFDLGRAFAEQGDRARAKRAFEGVAAADPDFQDVRERLAALDRPEAGRGSEPGLSDEDDAAGDALDALAADDEDAAAPAAADDGPSETFESFDDLIAEAETVLQPGARREESEAEPADALDIADDVAPATAEPARAATTGAETPAPPEPPSAPEPPPPAPAPPRRRKISFV